MRLHPGLRQGELSPLSAHGTKRFAGGKTLMPGEFSSPEQIKNGVPARCAASGGVDILGDLIDELENNGLYF